jgi:hypothetical protein
MKIKKFAQVGGLLLKHFGLVFYPMPDLLLLALPWERIKDFGGFLWGLVFSCATSGTITFTRENSRPSRPCIIPCKISPMTSNRLKKD